MSKLTKVYVIICTLLVLGLILYPPVVGRSQRVETCEMQDIKDLMDKTLIKSDTIAKMATDNTKVITKDRVITKVKKVTLKPKVLILSGDSLSIEIEPKYYKGYYVIDLDEVLLENNIRSVDTVEVYRKDTRNFVQRLLNKKY